MDELYILAKNRKVFNTALAAGEITQEQIAFIEDTNEIWARGKFYSSMSGYDTITIQNEQTDKNPYEISNEDSIKLAIKKLDKRTQKEIIRKKSLNEFPNIGVPGPIYLDESTGAEYLYNNETFTYDKITADIIYGGDSSDF